MVQIDWSQTWRTEEDLDDKRAERKIFNHSCDGLKMFLSIGHSCTPSISDKGFISACDDTNPVKIEYCPFCGAKLND